MSFTKFSEWLGVASLVIFVAFVVASAVRFYRARHELNSTGLVVPALVTDVEIVSTRFGRGGGVEIGRKAALTVEYACTADFDSNGIVFNKHAGDGVVQAIRAQPNLRVGRVYARSVEDAEQYVHDTVIRVVCSGDDLALANDSSSGK